MKSSIKLLLCGLLCVALVMAVFPWADILEAISVADTNTTDPTDGYFKIWNADQLFEFAQRVNSGDLDLNARLMADITVNEAPADGTCRSWTPIGNAELRYSGTFDGGGHQIRGLYFSPAEGATGVQTTGKIAYGLFSYVGIGGTVQNVDLSDCVISFPTAYSGGAIVGYNEGTVSGCTVSGSIGSKDCIIGGVVGRNDGTVTQCSNSGTIDGDGGIAGINYGTLSFCFNSGIIQDPDHTGGVAGVNVGTITECYNTGDIHCTGNDLGGITGENRGGSISSCYNTGKLHGKGRAIGGIAGTDTGTIRKCYYLKGCVAEDHYGIGRNEDIRGWTSGMTQKAFICGKVANLLGVSYGQNIDNGGVNGGLPVFSDANVYHHTKCNGKKAYSNYATYHHQDPATGNCVLCSGNCVHNYYGTVTAPGCTEDGHTTYTCIKCGDSYVRDVVPAFGHSYQDRRTDPTCTENGSLDSVCVTCGDTVTVSVLNASGHVYEESTVAPSCTEEGGQGYVCSSCGHTHIDEPVPPLGHSWAGGSCIRCGNTPTAVTVVRQPTSVQVPKGGTAKVSLEAEGEGLKYQWYIADPDSDRFSYSDAFTTRAYYIPMTERTNGRRVYCVVTDIYGNTVTTEIVTLSMAPALEIIRQPESVEVGDGEQARVSVGVRGHGVTYEWYYADPGSTEFRKTKSFTTKAYYIAMDAEKDGRQVYCVITDKYGDTLQTDTVTLSMHPYVQITRQPESVKAAMGEKAQISFAVKGEGVTYQWYFAKKGSTTFQKTNAFSTRYYYITMNEENDGRQVYCVATDRYGNSVRTDTVTLELQRHVQITKQPEDMTAASDTTVRFRVKATGDGLIYQWYIADPGSTTFRQDPKGTGKTYSVHMTEAKDGCRIYCVITDAYGNALKTVTVTLSME